MRLSEEQRVGLERLAESVVPGQGWQRAAVGFVEQVLTQDRPDWLGRVERGLSNATDADRAWLVRLIAQGFYADPAAWAIWASITWPRCFPH